MTWDFAPDDAEPLDPSTADADDAAPGSGPAPPPAGPAPVANYDDSEDDEVDPEEDELGRQRRQNVRVNVKYPITVIVQGYPVSHARSRDLSATGVGFATRMPLGVDTTGSVTVRFPDWEFTKEFVVRFVKPVLAGRIVGVQFDELTEDERERVVKEVFAVQRAQLQEQRAKQKSMAGD